MTQDDSIADHGPFGLICYDGAHSQAKMFTCRTTQETYAATHGQEQATERPFVNNPQAPIDMIAECAKKPDMAWQATGQAYVHSQDSLVCEIFRSKGRPASRKRSCAASLPTRSTKPWIHGRPSSVGPPRVSKARLFQLS